MPTPGTTTKTAPETAPETMYRSVPVSASAPGLLSRLNYGLQAMSANEKRIAHEILGAPGEVTSLSSQALAQRCKVSQSSIIKFCQKNGMAGFPALKIALSAEIARSEGTQQVHGDIFSDDSLGAVARKMFNSKVSALSDTLKLNSNEDIERAVAVLEKSARIIIFGIGGSALVASDLASKLTKFGKAVLFGGDSHIQLANLTSLGREDLLIAISYSGQTKEVLVAADYAQCHDIPVVFMGGVEPTFTPSARDVVLRCSANENLVRSSSIATRTAQFAVTDLLFVLLVQREGDVTSRILDSQSLVQKIR